MLPIQSPLLKQRSNRTFFPSKRAAQAASERFAEDVLFSPVDDKVVFLCNVIKGKSQRATAVPGLDKRYAICITVNNSSNVPRVHIIKVRNTRDFILKRSYLLKKLQRIHFGDHDDLGIQMDFMGNKTELVTCLEADSRNELIFYMMEVFRLYLVEELPVERMDVPSINMAAIRWAEQYMSSEVLKKSLNKLQTIVMHSILTGTHAEYLTEDKDSEEPETMEVPDMSDQEQRDLTHYLEESLLGLDEIDKLGDYLREKLERIESENIEAMFKCEPLNSQIIENMDVALNNIESATLWMGHNNPYIRKMKSGMNTIQIYNKKLELQEQNHEMLSETLQELLRDLLMEQNTIQVLQNPKFKTLPGLKQALKAAVKLEDTMTIKLDRGLEKMKAVMDRKAEFERLRNGFCIKSSQFFQQLFTSVAEKARDINSQTPSAALPSQKDIHLNLGKYQRLGEKMQNLDMKRFLHLSQNYTEKFSPVYFEGIESYFQTTRSQVIREHKDTRMQSFSDTENSRRNLSPDTDFLSPEYGLTRSHSQTSISTVTSSTSTQRTHHRNRSNLSISGFKSRKNSGTLLVTAAFYNALNAFAPLIMKEKEFCLQFFAIGGDFEFEEDLDRKSRNEDDVDAMVATLFVGLEEQMRDLVKLGNKMDPFYSLTMLVETEQMLMEYEHKSQFFTGVLTNLQTHGKLLFNKFSESQTEWIQNTKVTAKRCGVLSPLLKFPAFVDRMEDSLGKGQESQAGDPTYLKMVSTMFSWLENIAQQDPKYQDVVLMENYHYFYSVFRVTPIPALEQFVEKAKESYEKSMANYVSWSVAYEYKNSQRSLLEFWNEIDDRLKSNVPEDIPFTKGLSKQDLRQMCKDHLTEGKLKKTIDNMSKRLQKHLPKNFNLRFEVWKEVTEYFLERFNTFKDQIAQCYQSEKLPISSKTVKGLFQPKDGERTRTYSIASRNSSDLTSESKYDSSY